MLPSITLAMLTYNPIEFVYGGENYKIFQNDNIYKEMYADAYVQRLSQTQVIKVDKKDILSIKGVDHESVFRFLFAHEVGHVMSGHTRDRASDTFTMEREADCWAIKHLISSGETDAVAASYKFYDLLVEVSVTGRPGRSQHISFLDSCNTYKHEKD